MKYVILTAKATGFLGTDFEKAAKDLSGQVNLLLAEGWEPQGGVAVGTTQSTHEPHLLQAMVKEGR